MEKSIHLLKTTHQRRDLVVQRFVKPRLKSSFKYLALKVLGYNNSEGPTNCFAAMSITVLHK